MELFDKIDKVSSHYKKQQGTIDFELEDIRRGLAKKLGRDPYSFSISYENDTLIIKTGVRLLTDAEKALIERELGYKLDHETTKFVMAKSNG